MQGTSLAALFDRADSTALPALGAWPGRTAREPTIKETRIALTAVTSVVRWELDL